jgi:hypothetical protein
MTRFEGVAEEPDAAVDESNMNPNNANAPGPLALPPGDIRPSAGVTPE